VTRRFPLWTTLIPLGVGILVWAFLWRGYEAAFEADLAKLLPPGTAIEASGFPYRLEASVAPFDVTHHDSALALVGKAAEVTVNRVPWQRDRQVVNLRDSVLEARLKPLQGAVARIESGVAQASLRTDDARIARLSIVWQKPQIQTGLFATPAVAEQLELHLRETPSKGKAPKTAGPLLPTQAQIVLAGTNMRFGSGAPLALALNADLTAAVPITSLAGWTQGGTAEIRSITLSDATGEVARLTATVVPDGDGALRVAGTIETVCPMSVRAMVGGTAPVAELRTRKPERIAFSGILPGGITAEPRDPAKPSPPVRGQEPACPRLR
jgi:hypothetical protein